MSNKGKRKAWAIGASCIAIGLVAAVMAGMMPTGGDGRGGGNRGGTGTGTEDQARQKTIVETNTPSLGTIAVTSSYVGTVEPGRQITIYPKASAEVIAANFSVGDTVEAGDILFQLDSTSLQLDIAKSQATLANSQAKAQLTLENARQTKENYDAGLDEGLNSALLKAENDVLSAGNKLQSANTGYNDARRAYNDYIRGDSDEEESDSKRDSLRSAKVKAELELESAQQALENAKANLEIAKKDIEEAKTKNESDIKSAEIGADLTADYISLQKLQNDLFDYTATAPIGGVIEQKNIDVYDMASTQTAAYVISNKELLSITFSVAESALSYISPGKAITLEKDGESCTGAISEVSTMVDASSGLYTVKATVENPPFALYSGSSVKLWAETQKVENEMLIPIDAVYYDNGSPYVFVFRDNAAHRVNVELGISDTESIQVISGLSLTDEIIVTWSSSLYDGAEVYLPGTAPAADDASEGAVRAPTDGTPAGEGSGREEGEPAAAGEPMQEGGEETGPEDAEEETA